ncbi:MAG: periplasmic heavy metal sensor [Pyrinomonadaceae bacterium MAG19_C2-C3]|nr:periplasmic heavy metal sensor [Pyrinomonadaceae bacterium MAG19_C2-C3]
MNRLTGNKLKIWLVIVLVFVLGCVTGASLVGVYRSQFGGGRERHRSDVFERLRRDLNLSDKQAAQVRAVLDETREEYRRLRAEARPRYDRIRDDGRTRIRAVLTAEQQKIFDLKVAERDARDARREERNGR